jgi:Fe-S cluster assembly iron-binding protein IscA
MARSELDVVTFTDGARAHVVAFLAEEEEPLSVRIEVLDSSPLTPRYDLSLIEESEREPGDQVFEQEGFEVVVPMASVDLLRGATVEAASGS